MLQHLGNKLDDFAGEANQTRCFAHTLNLAAKAIIKQFDAPKTETYSGDSGELDHIAQALSNTALELEDDEQGEMEDDKPLTDAEWVRIHEELGFEDWDEAVEPVRSTLHKVHKP
jgi:hypothetical protein